MAAFPDEESINSTLAQLLMVMERLDARIGARPSPPLPPRTSPLGVSSIVFGWWTARMSSMSDLIPTAARQRSTKAQRQPSVLDAKCCGHQAVV